MQDCNARRDDFGIAGKFSAGTAELLTEHDVSGQIEIDLSCIAMLQAGCAGQQVFHVFLAVELVRLLRQLRRLRHRRQNPLREMGGC